MVQSSGGRVASVLFVAMLVMSAVPGAAGTVSPYLDALLASSPSDAEVEILVDLVGPLDVGSRSYATKVSRRIELVRALRTHALHSEAPVREFLVDRGASKVVSLWAIGGLAVTAPAETVRDLALHPAVEGVRLDGRFALPPRLTADTAGPEWNLAMVGAPELWARGLDGDGVVVAVVDSGVDAQHQDLGPRYRGGANSWFDPYGEHPEPHDVDGHGTHAAGLLVGGDAGGTAIGVAPGARWIGGRAFNDAGEATYSAIHLVYQWLLDPDGDPDTDDAPDVVNSSWGFPGLVGQCFEEFAEDVAVLRAAGIAAVFSAGNGGPNPASSLSPANNPGAFPVGGVDDRAEVMSASSRGPSACDGGIYPAVVAPGEGVRTADKTFGGAFPDAYMVVSGTSFAAPHVAGAMALLLQAHPGASVVRLEQALRAGAGDLGSDGPDNDAGWGLLDVAAAEAALAGLMAGPGTVTAYTDEAEFLMAVEGHDTVFESFEDDAAWGDARTPATRPVVTSQTITWTSNHPANDVTTGIGPARTGLWGFYSLPHGDQTVTDPNDFMTDGFVGTGATPLTAVGGWVVGTPGGQVELVLDGDDDNSIELGRVGNSHTFYGVVTSGSFSSYEFRETEGTREDQKILFIDDVTVSLAEGGVVQNMTGVVAGVANLPGAQGSDWHSDLFLHNASQAAVDVDLAFSPAGGTAGDVERVTVGPGETEALEDVVATLFGVQASGAIHWRVDPAVAASLMVSANTYNRIDDDRRYGQQVAGIRWAETSATGASTWVPALAGPYRTNLGFGTDEGCTEVVVRGYDRMGDLVAERTLDVQPLSWLQLNGLFRNVFPNLIDDPDGVALADSVHRFEVMAVNGRVAAYTSIIDNATSDGSYMVGQQAAGAQESVWLPGAARLSGVNDSRWRSDVILMHVGGSTDSTSFGFFDPGANPAGSVDTEAVTLDPGASSVQEDILGSLFGYSPPVVGSLLAMLPESSGGLVWMRTYTEESVNGGDVETYGQAIGPGSYGAMVSVGAEGRIYGFSHDAGTRSNLILQNTRSAGGDYLVSEILVELVGADGSMLHQQGYSLEPGEYFQHNRFVDAYDSGPIRDASLVVTLLSAPVSGETGGIDAMVSEVNGNSVEGTNDSRLLRAEMSEIP